MIAPIRKARLDDMETHLNEYGIVPLHGSGTTIQFCLLRGLQKIGGTYCFIGIMLLPNKRSVLVICYLCI